MSSTFFLILQNYFVEYYFLRVSISLFVFFFAWIRTGIQLQQKFCIGHSIFIPIKISTSIFIELHAHAWTQQRWARCVLWHEAISLEAIGGSFI